MICYSQGGKSILETSHLQGMTIRPREQILAKTLHIKMRHAWTYNDSSPYHLDRTDPCGFAAEGGSVSPRQAKFLGNIQEPN
jgi:hypothetical protein